MESRTTPPHRARPREQFSAMSRFFLWPPRKSVAVRSPRTPAVLRASLCCLQYLDARERVRRCLTSLREELHTRQLFAQCPQPLAGHRITRLARGVDRAAVAVEALAGDGRELG